MKKSTFWTRAVISRLTEDDHQALEDIAISKGLRLGSYVRQLLLEHIKEISENQKQR